MLLFEGIDLHHYYTAIALNMDIMMPLRFCCKIIVLIHSSAFSGQIELDSWWAIYLATLCVLVCMARATVSFG